MAHLEELRVPIEGTSSHYLAGKYDYFHLSKLLKNHREGVRSELYFKTRSRNIYKIAFDDDDSKTQGEGFFLTNIRHPKAKYELTSGELNYGEVKLQKQFLYGHGMNTTQVIKIVRVITDARSDLQRLNEAIMVSDYFTAIRKGGLKTASNK